MSSRVKRIAALYDLYKRGIYIDSGDVTGSNFRKIYRAVIRLQDDKDDEQKESEDEQRPE